MALKKYTYHDKKLNKKDWADAMAVDARECLTQSWKTLGGIFNSVKSELEHGDWLDWLNSTFGGEVTDRQAQRLMKAAKTFEDSPHEINMPQTAAFRLSEKNTPAEVIDEALKLSKKQYVTTTVVENLLMDYRTKETKAANKAQKEKTESRDIVNTKVSKTDTHKHIARAREEDGQSFVYPSWVVDHIIPLGDFNPNRSYATEIKRIEIGCTEWKIPTSSFAAHIANVWPSLQLKFKVKNPLTFLGNSKGTTLNIQLKEMSRQQGIGKPTDTTTCSLCNGKGWVAIPRSQEGVIKHEPDESSSDGWEDNAEQFMKNVMALEKETGDGS